MVFYMLILGICFGGQHDGFIKIGFLCSLLKEVCDVSVTLVLASSIFDPSLATVFATGQSVRPEPGRGRTAACRPIRSFSKVARQVRIKDEDGRHSVVPSCLFWNLPHTSE